jgi:hypothetical protein
MKVFVTSQKKDLIFCEVLILSFLIRVSNKIILQNGQIMKRVISARFFTDNTRNGILDKTLVNGHFDMI